MLFNLKDYLFGSQLFIESPGIPQTIFLNLQVHVNYNRMECHPYDHNLQYT